MEFTELFYNWLTVVVICDPLISVIWSDRGRELWASVTSSMFLGCWSISVEQFAGGTQEHVTNSWPVTVH